MLTLNKHYEISGSYLLEMFLEIALIDKEEAKKEAYLKLKGFNVVGSMENPPTNPDAVKAAGCKA